MFDDNHNVFLLGMPLTVKVKNIELDVILLYRFGENKGKVTSIVKIHCST